MIKHAANITNDNKADISRFKSFIDLEVTNHHPTKHHLQHKNYGYVLKYFVVSKVSLTLFESHRALKSIVNLVPWINLDRLDQILELLFIHFSNQSLIFIQVKGKECHAVVIILEF